VKKFWKFFCKSIIKGRRVEISDLKEIIDDEAVDIDIVEYKDLFSDDAWNEVQRRGMCSMGKLKGLVA